MGLWNSFEYLSLIACISKKSINGHSKFYKGKLIRIKGDKEVYFVKSVENGKLVLRKEIPEDMPYEEHFIKIKELKSESGDFDIELAYPRGC